MQINNPLRMTNWEIKKFLKVVLSVQFAMWGVIGLDAIGYYGTSYLYMFFLSFLV